MAGNDYGNVGWLPRRDTCTAARHVVKFFILAFCDWSELVGLRLRVAIAHLIKFLNLLESRNTLSEKAHGIVSVLGGITKNDM